MFVRKKQQRNPTDIENHMGLELAAPTTALALQQAAVVAAGLQSSMRSSTVWIDEKFDVAVAENDPSMQNLLLRKKAKLVLATTEIEINKITHMSPRDIASQITKPQIATSLCEIGDNGTDLAYWFYVKDIPGLEVLAALIYKGYYAH